MSRDDRRERYIHRRLKNKQFTQQCQDILKQQEFEKQSAEPWDEDEDEPPPEDLLWIDLTDKNDVQ